MDQEQRVGTLSASRWFGDVRTAAISDLTDARCTYNEMYGNPVST